jgi:hypothetical protein
MGCEIAEGYEFLAIEFSTRLQWRVEGDPLSKHMKDVACGRSLWERGSRVILEMRALTAESA